MFLLSWKSQYQASTTQTGPNWDSLETFSVMWCFAGRKPWKLWIFPAPNENHRGNIDIRLQKTKRLQTNISVEVQMSSDAPKPASEEENPENFEFFSSKVIFFSLRKEKGNTSQQQLSLQTSLSDLRPASLWFPPCWLFVVAALGCSEISSQQTTKTDFQQQFVRFLKEGCELNGSHCNARTPPHPPHPPRPPHPLTPPHPPHPPTMELPGNPISVSLMLSVPC